MNAYRLYATVVTALALGAGLAGVAIAGSGPTASPAGKAGKVLKDAKQAKKKAKKATKVGDAVSSDEGPQGEKGNTGPAGSEGQQGSPGADAASFYTSQIASLPPGAGTEFGFINSTSGPSGTEADVAMLSPNREIEIGDLAVVIDTAPGDPGDSRTFTVRVLGVSDTAVACTITDDETSCDSGAASATIAPATPLSIAVESVGTPAAADARLGFRASTP